MTHANRLAHLVPFVPIFEKHAREPRLFSRISFHLISYLCVRKMGQLGRRNPLPFISRTYRVPVDWGWLGQVGPSTSHLQSRSSRSMIEITPQSYSPNSAESELTDRREKRRKKIADWRATNRQHLREYGRTWKLEHADRIKIHREKEYAQRRKKRRRFRLRREAQRRRRALERLRLTDPIAWAKLKGRTEPTRREE